MLPHQKCARENGLWKPLLIMLPKASRAQKFKIAILEADDAERALVMMDLVIKKLNPVTIIQTEFTPVLGVHRPGSYLAYL